MSKAITLNGWECEMCSKKYMDKYSADVCCKIYYCEDCGKKAEKYRKYCKDCEEKRAFQEAIKLSVEKYEAAYPGHMVFDGFWTFYSSVSKLLEWLSDDCERPAYCWGTDKIEHELDAEYILSQFYDEINCEDLSFDNEEFEELKDLLKPWNEKHSTTTYVPNDIAILIPPLEGANDE